MKTENQKEYIYRLFDFHVFNETRESESSSEDSGSKPGKYKDRAVFKIQMFGVNEQGETCCIFVDEFKPFFYVKVENNFTTQMKNEFLMEIKEKIGKYYESSIEECKLIDRKKLYGFDGGKEHKFIHFQFSNVTAFNKVRNLWYDNQFKLLKTGYKFKNKMSTYLYESNIPPLLRFFHIRDISPSGWISVSKSKTCLLSEKRTTCDVEFSVYYENIIALNEKETRVPFKICSFDIEASSSHGDFPVPVKTYKKLATNIMEYFEKFVLDNQGVEKTKQLLSDILLTAFQYECKNVKRDHDLKHYIDVVYPIHLPKTRKIVESLIERWLQKEVNLDEKEGTNEIQEMQKIETMFERMNTAEEDEENEYNKHFTKETGKKTIVEWLTDKTASREEKLASLNCSLNETFPKLEGDKVTFIGSTFMKYGEEQPYFNHCIVLNTCAPLPVAQSQLESYKTEKEVLMAWQKLIQRENPDIVIGYNIFGFDYQFMFQRAQENGCTREFLQLSRNVDEICWTKDPKTEKYHIEESSIQIASGQHDLKFIKMTGRLQIDLYNFFRREENLTSYKLDFVSGHFIGDYVKKWEQKEDNKTKIVSGNLKGLQEGSFVHLEEIGHSVDYYDGGAKFKVLSTNLSQGEFEIDGHVQPDSSKKVRWCLAKDDVSPKDIFRMTNGTDEDRAVIAKYCLQDCNLVHYLLNKVDVITGFIEMAKICSVPMNFLVMRGQGIKLTSYIAKKCREKGVLMPVIEKGNMDEGYEGAIVLDPKCDLYLDNPVACVDYASLYPSSMISENLSHDSKVWSQEFDLEGKLIKETGEKDAEGNFIYDNLPNYEYVNITYDTYKYVRKSAKAAAEKVISGKKTCRFAQFNEGKAIMPSILEELLQARKATRKQIPLQNDEFMKNVLDKRQQGYKVTANSLYGQCGAKTSTFYEKDIAACTTATGRLLLTYAKKIIENCYGDSICQTEKHGPVLTKAEYIYGDTDSVFFTFNLHTPEGKPIRGKEALEITIELAQEAGHLASSFLKGPHDLEYEKTFMPFCLLSKKRYVGMLYEMDPNKGKRKEMGIVLKRRDNAPIVKDIYGGIIDILMKEQNIMKAVEFLKSCLKNIVNESYPVEKLIITKSLRSHYKNPQSIAHKVLADRITARDPGNKPGAGDRIPFVYVHNANKKALQGEKIETPGFISENHLKIDYSFYITNQIMKPVQQVFALVIEKIWEIQKKQLKIKSFKKETELLKKNTPVEKWDDKWEQLRNKEVKELLFDEFLRESNNGKTGNQNMNTFFKPIQKMK